MVFPSVEKSTISVTPKVTPHVTPQVTPQVEKLLSVLDGELNRQSIQEKLNLSDRKYFRLNFLQPALEAGVIEMTIPDKPQSSKQLYRITEEGKAVLEK